MLKAHANQVSSDLDDEDNSLLEPALVVNEYEDTDFDLNIPPTTGNEYLRREAQNCPKVVVANLDTKIFNNRQTVKIQTKDCMPAPHGFGPRPDWVKMQIEDFVQLRQKIAHFKALLTKKKVTLPAVCLPLANDAESWCRLSFGRLQLKTSARQEESDATGGIHGETQLQNDGTGTPPLLSIIARMDQQQIERVLEYHTNWLEATGFTRKQGQWFYALLSVLQKPLTPEACSWLRQLARLCSIIRASLVSTEDEAVHQLNLLICIVARYFDQGDLADKT
ncbi:hypothetical protein C0Q70_14965 [Pomacea canaliculata]|uniref:Gem-associated protein 2 n=1 Tax=Pomacea canaliculata TaxID=400727 RepID=A0A2T7NTJ0_POMCA|nr:hypothetical protein C0Q70_14965 [Pomacea canaliculata]